MKIDRENFLKKSNETLNGILDTFDNLPILKLEDMDPGSTALIIVDMVNGFAREGALQSPRVNGLVTDIADLSTKCEKFGIHKIAFADCHTDESPEFGAFPPHCLTGTSESEIVDEIKEIGGYDLIEKNSTNGYLEKGFKNWLANTGSYIDNFIIVGDCTDICVQQFATTLKTHFNKLNIKNIRIIVPTNMVETYDFGLHYAELMNVMSLFFMNNAGIELVSKIV